MHPVPCKHCGIHFMRQTNYGEDFEICNNCKLIKLSKNPKKVEAMQETEIRIKVPTEVYKKIEMECNDQGLTFSDYFLGKLNVYTNKESPQLVDNDDENLTKKQYKKGKK